MDELMSNLKHDTNFKVNHLKNKTIGIINPNKSILYNTYQIKRIQTQKRVWKTSSQRPMMFKA